MYLPYNGLSEIWKGFCTGGVEGDEFLDEGTDEGTEEAADEAADEPVSAGVSADGLSSTGDSFDFGL